MTSEEFAAIRNAFSMLLAISEGLADAAGVNEADVEVTDLSTDGETYTLAELREHLMDIFKISAINTEVSREA